MEGIGMKALIFQSATLIDPRRLAFVRILTVLCGCACFSEHASAQAAPEILVVVGAAGTEEYEAEFGRWTDRWRKVAKDSGASLRLIAPDEPHDLANDREQLQRFIQAAATKSTTPFWMILIGHGTYARDTAKFNLRGPDVSAAELAEWFADFKRPLVIVNCASASGPFIDRLSAPGRVIVSATKSGTQQNYARFGKYFVEAILSPHADLDHDDAVSVHEAFLRASSDVADFYVNEARIATEHALIDDNGDRRGTPATMFRGVRPIAEAKDGTPLDGQLARKMTLAPIENQLPLTSKQVRRREELEQQLEELRAEKKQLDEQAYHARIEPLLIQLAKIYQAAESKQARKRQR